MSWEQAAVIVTAIGLLVGNLAKVLPFIPNQIIPKIVWTVNILGNIVLVLNKFLIAAGFKAVAIWQMERAADGVTWAGFNFLNGLLVVLGAAALGYFQLLLQRLAAEKAIKPVQNNHGESGDL